MSRLNYTLPDEYHGRELEGYVEKVDYYLNSNIRIWTLCQMRILEFK